MYRFTGNRACLYCAVLLISSEYCMGLFAQLKSHTSQSHEGRLMGGREYSLEKITPRTRTRGVTSSPDGELIAAVYADGSAHLWRIPTDKNSQHEKIACFRLPVKMMSAIEFSPDGKSIVTGSDDGTVRYWRAARGGEQLRMFNHVQVPIMHLCYCHEGASLISVDPENTIRVWQSSTGKLLRTIHNKQHVDAIAGSPREPVVAIGLSDAIVILDTSNSSALSRIASVPESIRLISYSFDGRMIAIVRKNSIQIYESTTMMLIKELPISRANASCFSKNNRFLIGGTSTGKVFIYDIPTGIDTELLRVSGEIFFLSYTPRGELLVFGRSDASNAVWRIPQQFLITSLRTKEKNDLDAVTNTFRRSAELNRFPPGIWLWNSLSLLGPMYSKLPSRLSDEDCRKLWSNLRDDVDGMSSYWAICCFVNCPDQAVSYLGRNLRTVPSPDDSHIRRLIDNLDNDDFQVRDAASKELKRLGDSVFATLRNRLKEHISPESRKRIEELLTLEQSFLSERLRICRAIQALEYIGTPDAMLILDRLSKGASESRITREAKISILHHKGRGK